MKPVRWSVEARSDFEEIDGFLRSRNPESAQKVLAQAVAAATFLQRVSGAGERIRQTRFRRWRVSGTPYILLYRESETALDIVRVIHAARDWQRFL